MTESHRCVKGTYLRRNTIDFVEFLTTLTGERARASNMWQIYEKRSIHLDVQTGRTTILLYVKFTCFYKAHGL